MKILPAVTEPPPRRRRRRHRPTAARGKKGYQKYKECLRWEFAFSCAFCLLHEADVGNRSPELRKGRRDFDIEHRVGRKEDRRRINDYGNVYYCCASCNAARSTRKVKAPDGKLLDPCRVGWGYRFHVIDFELQPRKDSDRDARRTVRVYDLNSKDKVTMRRNRSEARTLAEQRWREVAELIERLRAKWHVQPEPDLLDAERELWGKLEDITALLCRYRAIPSWAARPCACTPSRARLPRWLARQCSELQLEPSIPAPASR